MNKIIDFLNKIFAPRVVKNTYYYGTNFGDDKKVNRVWKKLDGVWEEITKVFSELEELKRR